MKIYHYDAHGVFVGETEARMSPREKGVPLVPARATLEAPPAALAGQAPVWDGTRWAARPDNRGTEYWLADQTLVVIEAVGEAVPPEAVMEPPPDGDRRRRWDGNAWTLPPEAVAEDAARAAKERLAELDLQSVRKIRELLIEKHPEDPRAIALAAVEDEARAERAKLPGRG